MSTADLQFVVLSDLHLNGQPERHTAVERTLRTAAAQAPGAYLIVNGDLTDTGTPDQFAEYNALIAASPFAGRTLATLGNHDVRGPRWPEWDNTPLADPRHFHTVAAPFYTDYLAGLASVDRQGLSLAMTVGPIAVILLNTEKGLKDSAEFSPATLQWLAGTLAHAAAQQRPALIFCHQPLRNTHWRSNFGGGVGLQDAALKTILRTYPNTVFISGHIHNGFGVTGVIDRPYGVAVDLPALAVSENGYQGQGSGFLLTLTADRLAWAAWDFTAAQRLPQFDFTVPLPTAAALVQAIEATAADWAALQEIWSVRFDQHLFDDPRTDGGTEEPPAPLYTHAQQTALTAVQQHLLAAWQKAGRPAADSAAPATLSFDQPIPPLTLRELAQVAQTLWAAPTFTTASHLVLQFALARVNVMLSHPAEFSETDRQTAQDHLVTAMQNLRPKNE